MYPNDGMVVPVPLDGGARAWLRRELEHSDRSEDDGDFHVILRCLAALERAERPATTDMSTREGMDALVHLLALVGRKVSAAAVAGWTPAEREDVRAWAQRVWGPDHPALLAPGPVPACLTEAAR